MIYAEQGYPNGFSILFSLNPINLAYLLEHKIFSKWNVQNGHLSVLCYVFLLKKNTGETVKLTHFAWYRKILSNGEAQYAYLL